jgi:hypothetical protein
MQDLREINEAIVPIHPIVPNLCNILAQIPTGKCWFTVLRLNAFFRIPLDHKSQSLFAFEWTSPESLGMTQSTWTVLPRGFRDSPHLLGNVLAKELQTLTLNCRVLMQYMDDLLIFSPTKQNSDGNTLQVLNLLGKAKYREAP